VDVGLWVHGRGFSIYSCPAYSRTFWCGLRLHDQRHGLRRGLYCIMFPLENLVLRMHQAVGGSHVVAWLLILLQLSSLSFQRMGFSKFCDLDPPHVDATKFNCKAPYIFSSALLHPRSGHWALRMASCRLLCRFNARSDRLRQIRCSRFQLRIISWAGTLYMLCCSFLCPLGCTLPRDFLDIDGHIVAYRYEFVCTSVVGPSSQAMVG